MGFIMRIERGYFCAGELICLFLGGGICQFHHRKMEILAFN